MSLDAISRTRPRSASAESLAPPPPHAASVAAIEPSPVSLASFSDARRQATRPLHARDAGFDDAFDADTLFFDAFRSADDRAIVLIGPPLFNLAPALRHLVVRDVEGRVLPVTRIRRLDRQVQLWVAARPGVRHLVVETGLGRFPVTVGASHAGLFAGRRVLLTKSRDNPLPWILDWIRFNRDVNGADAVLFYDNASRRYSLDTLRAAIAGVEGMRAAAVVSWPFKFGPQGPNGSKFWDSDFCELGAWEHARWRFLARARSVLAGDVDELALGRDKTPFEAAETSLSGVARYHGRWIVGASATGTTDDLALRRHRHYDTTLRPSPARNRLGWRIDGNRCAAKWTLVPARCPAFAQWRTHTIRHWPQSYLLRKDVGFGHFRAINTSWKYDRDGVVGLDTTAHERHGPLAAAMARVDWDR